MCGRYTLSSPGEAIAELFELAAAPRLEPRYNIAPTQECAVVRQGEQGRELRMLRWGLVPYWAVDPSGAGRLINARSETAASKPSFESSFRRRRCLVPADGFFEWRRLGGRRQPYLVRLRGGPPFAFAGLWDRWVPHQGEPLESFTILTTVPNPRVARLHDRMPVILAPASHPRWLDPAERDPARLEPLLAPVPEDRVEMFPVSTVVNSPANEDPRCVAPLPGWEEDAQLRL